ncbi:cobalt-precorrin-6A reductase [Rhizobium sp. R72]|uniref:cobalt-precorrin-6A reductase n=1 Tax=unclassified Rhizobium TaxID=2613769 RepID=UPI000B5332A3|nr:MULTISPECIES: cobalt-precorrin-6A reductase [unclassified Rhizobium]OWV97486.1 cobalt-precorrin-6A reductase [Rhizobium sp. R72]OWV97825.1 cobalt-precorrin-6A reductase [Rhizobium sp. R711]
MGKIRILMLGGTGEARALAKALADNERYDVLHSLAGRTQIPSDQPVPVRIGGFGGAEGLAAFLRDGRFDLMIDATHPFASRISRNACDASAAVGIPTFALRRPEWLAEPGDRWTHVTTVTEAIEKLGPSPRRVFLAIGRQEAHRAEVAPHHFYLVRSIDPVEPPLDLPEVHMVLDRGPYDVESEALLLRAHRIEALVTKNSGGSATYAKIQAARRLGIEVIMVARAPAAAMQTVTTIEAMLAAIAHLFPPAMNRGV